MRRRATLGRARRFALVGVVVGALGLIVATGVTFTATTSTTAVSISAGSGTTSTVTTSGVAPNSAESMTWPKKTAASAPQAAVWTPVAGSPVSVTTAGDIAIVDATQLTSGTTITLALLNASDLSGTYSTFILPVDLQEWSGSSWGAVSGYSGDQYLTLHNGQLNFTVAGGKYYALWIGTGGALTASGNGSTYGPTFLVQTN